MEEHCTSHPLRHAASVCHACGRSFCWECLDEGGDFYYCRDEACQKQLRNESSRVSADHSAAKSSLLTRLWALSTVQDEGGIASWIFPFGAAVAGLGFGGLVFYFVDGRISLDQTGLPFYVVVWFWLYSLFLALRLPGISLRIGACLMLCEGVVRLFFGRSDSPLLWLASCSLFVMSGAFLLKGGFRTSSSRRRVVGLILFGGFAASRYLAEANWASVLER